MSASSRPAPLVPAPFSPGDLADALVGLRDRQPLVHCLTNIVVAQWTANVLLAVGASPVMVDNEHEAGAFAAVADGVLVNLGTPYEDTIAAMAEAVSGASAAGTPWVLDPVAAGALAWRTDVAQRLISRGSPVIIRGNASEVLGLTGGQGGKGVETTDAPESALPVARELAREHATVVAVSGAVDQLTDGARVVRIANGHELLTRVTGVGCALGALMAGFAGVVGDPLLAAATATATLTVAADAAARTSHGPGSFAVALLDRLSTLTPQQLAERVRFC